MPVATPTLRALDVVRVEANSFKILGFEVHTETEVSGDDRVVVRKEARTMTAGRVTSRTPMRVTEYTSDTMLPVLADIARRFAGALGATVPPVGDSTLGYALYLAFRDGLYDAERRSGEFPADAT